MGNDSPPPAYLAEPPRPSATTDDTKVALVEVTSAMIDAGVEEMREHHYGDDVRYILECVFRAMAYASPLASSMSEDNPRG